MQLATTHAVATAADLTTVVYTLAGGAAPFATCPLQRYFRDAHVVTQHAGVAAANWLQPVGTVLLGGDPGPGVPW